jgi:hypothetical protein
MRKVYPIVTPWKTIHEDFAALVFGGYMIETEKGGTIISAYRIWYPGRTLVIPN